MKKFKLPRKLKKVLRKGLLLYPADKTGSSLMAWPYKYEEDFRAYKRGALLNLWKRTRV